MNADAEPRHAWLTNDGRLMDEELARTAARVIVTQRREHGLHLRSVCAIGSGETDPGTCCPTSPALCALLLMRAPRLAACALATCAWCEVYVMRSIRRYHGVVATREP